LQRRIGTFLDGGSDGVIGETTIHRIKDVMGYYTQVELALSASRTSGSTMVTAILREIAARK
ncbi:MAG TPA: hypothetical protein VNX25_03575, partial [Verrucomicrobiae bacterium]|nr:hypothetical protein [Verrucomicrobiae bacterium]